MICLFLVLFPLHAEASADKSNKASTTIQAVIKEGVEIISAAAMPVKHISGTKHEPQSLTDEKIGIPNDRKPFGFGDIVVPQIDHYFAIFTFVMIGNAQLLIWNMVINSFTSMQSYIWPGHAFSDILGGCEHGAALLVAIVMLKFSALNVKMCHFAGIATIIFYLIFPLIPQFFAAESSVIGTLDGKDIYGTLEGQKDNLAIARGLLSAVSILLGTCVGFMHVYGYAIAAVLPTNYVVYVSTGNGVAGVVSFVAYTIFFNIFPQTPIGQVKLMWAFFILGAVLSLVQVISFWILSRKEWFNQCLELARTKKAEDTERVLREWGERRGVVAIFKDCGVQAFNAGFTLFVTLLLFPMTGPFGWKQNANIANGLNGTFQVVDLLIRWMPSLGGWTKIKKSWVLPLVLMRLVVFIPLFMLPARILNLPFLGATWWLFILMILFTITNGWFTTVSSIYCPECVDHPAEKEIASEIFVILLLFFVTIGVFGSKILIL